MRERDGTPETLRELYESGWELALLKYHAQHHQDGLPTVKAPELSAPGQDSAATDHPSPDPATSPPDSLLLVEEGLMASRWSTLPAQAEPSQASGPAAPTAHNPPHSGRRNARGPRANRGGRGSGGRGGQHRSGPA